jgi:hypothetical protein
MTVDGFQASRITEVGECDPIRERRLTLSVIDIVKAKAVARLEEERIP